MVRYLGRRGLAHLASNVSTRQGEVDIVMLDRDCMVFVEVRYRGPRSLATAIQTVDARKQRRIQAAAGAFLAQHPEHYDRVCRFDVVGVDRTLLGTLRLNWIKDAFRVE